HVWRRGRGHRTRAEHDRAGSATDGGSQCAPCRARGTPHAVWSSLRASTAGHDSAGRARSAGAVGPWDAGPVDRSALRAACATAGGGGAARRLVRRAGERVGLVAKVRPAARALRPRTADRGTHLSKLLELFVNLAPPQFSMI